MWFWRTPNLADTSSCIVFWITQSHILFCFVGREGSVCLFLFLFCWIGTFVNCHIHFFLLKRKKKCVNNSMHKRLNDMGWSPLLQKHQNALWFLQMCICYCNLNRIKIFTVIYFCSLLSKEWFLHVYHKCVIFMSRFIYSFFFIYFYC